MKRAENLAIKLPYSNHKIIYLNDDNYKKCRDCIAFQCAPVLSGIKASNLLILKHKICRRVIQEIHKAEANFKELYNLSNRKIYLIYKYNSLLKIIDKPKIKEYLIKIGYKNSWLDFLMLNECIEFLAKRLKDSMEKRGSFPHEIGIFMGYPLEDVIGFIENEGRNYEFSGYWKVYHKKEVAKRLFKQYDLARDMAIKHISRGGSFSQLKSLYVMEHQKFVKS